MTDETPQTRFCPFCGESLRTRPASRFVECPEHGGLIVNASRVAGTTR